MIVRAWGPLRSRIASRSWVWSWTAWPRVGHAVEHQVPDAQRVREVALERLGEVRVARGVPDEAVDPLVHPHERFLRAGAVERLDLAHERLGLRACLGVEPEGGQLGRVPLELGAHLGDVLDVGGLDRTDEGAAPGLHLDEVLEREPLDRLAQRRAADADVLHQLVLPQHGARREMKRHDPVTQVDVRALGDEPRGRGVRDRRGSRWFSGHREST